MTTQENHNYQRIAGAINYIRDHFKSQPDLEQVAQHVHLSPYHFQRLFKEWAGVSPKKFLQYTSVEYAKQILKEQQATLFDAATETGLSGTGRLHDLFISIEGMTPGEFKNGGKSLVIAYDFLITPFGKCIVVSTEKGICFMYFEEDEEKAMDELFRHFPNADFTKQSTCYQQSIHQLFANGDQHPEHIKLHLHGTSFQLKVWDALLKIPSGSLTTYGSLADKLDSPKASRAVGAAIGKNPVAFLIPCHRVIQSSGLIGGYRWGITRKQAMIGWEASKVKKYWSNRLDMLADLLDVQEP